MTVPLNHYQIKRLTAFLNICLSVVSIKCFIINNCGLISQLLLSIAAWLSSWSDALPHSVISSSHSLWGLPLLFVPSIHSNISSIIFLLSCILHYVSEQN